MRIVQLTPGSGDTFYCENCIRDLVLVRAVREAGHEMLMVPMYLPLNQDSQPLEQKAPIFFGGLNVYFQQKFNLFRKTPRWLDRIFDNRGLLKWVGKLSGMTTPAQLGEMTLSMLSGPDGRQAKEVDRLVEFLASPENKPDVIVLSNMLLAGLAGPIRRRLDCKLVCWLQDEDGFVDGLGNLWTEKVWNNMKEKVAWFDMFLPVSHFYANLMQRRLNIPGQKIKTFTPGIDISKYEPAQNSPDVPTLGFLGRMCPANGFDITTAAFNNLALGENTFFENARLLICGGKTSADTKYIKRHLGGLDCPGLSGHYEVLEDFDFKVRLEFFRRLSVLCSPSRQAPAYALNVLEAMACGVPFVAPKAGVFTEWAKLSGAGVLYEPNTPQQLQKNIESLLRDTAALKELSQKGRQTALEHFDVRKNAAALVDILGQL